MKKLLIPFLLVVLILGLTIGITIILPRISNRAGIQIRHIETSSKSFSKECADPSITVNANITSPSGIKSAVLWHRNGDDQPYTQVNMNHKAGDLYSVTIQGSDVPGIGYGTWEFYITAEDKLGNRSQSKSDKSVNILPCVGN